MHSQNHKLLETKRLQLLPFTYDLMKATLRGKERLEKLLDVAIPNSWPGPDLVEALPEFIAQMEQATSALAWNWLLIHKGTRSIIGEVGFKSGPDMFGRVEIGYNIVPEYRNQGYASEVTLYLIHWALRQRQITTITAECLHDNAGSIKVLEKAGMRLLEPSGKMLRWEMPKRI